MRCFFLNCVLSVSIWEVPKELLPVRFVGNNITYSDFTAHYSSFPFIFHNFTPQTTLSDEILLNLLGEYRASYVETQLKEDRESSALSNVLLADFFRIYRSRSLYLTSQAPPPLRDLLLFPGLLTGVLRFFLTSPMVWLAAGQTKSAIHRDSDANFHCILDGSKRFLLWPSEAPIATAEFGWYEAPKGERGYGEWARELDVEDVKEPYLSKYRSLPEWYVGKIEAGDCMYLPPGWFHYVESADERTLSYHMWFRLIPEISELGNKVHAPYFRASACSFKYDFYGVGDFEDVGVPGQTSRCRF